MLAVAVTTVVPQRTASDGVHPTVSCGLLTKALKDRGFQHLGPTSVLSFMQVLCLSIDRVLTSAGQAAGLVNHHCKECFVFDEIEASA